MQLLNCRSIGIVRGAWQDRGEAGAKIVTFLLLCSVVRRVVSVQGIVHVDLVSCKNACLCVSVCVRVAAHLGGCYILIYSNQILV